MNLYELMASVTLDTSGYEGGVRDAINSSGRLSAKAVAVGKVMADAFEKVVKVVAKLAKQAVKTGMKFETSFAKVKTIMDPKEMGFAEMEEAIIQLSTQTGISAAELSDTVYNVISATGDTAHAVDLARQATMLATAGFTDSASALSVLTTAMNAYGISADEATHISDSMIMVQNLGVTTVGELSSVMGKAIATGSAYGVNLENLETGYVSLTKAGIGTSEATTYLSGMMNELGKDGSKVSEILENKTGKSFGELMNEGNSLGDVLEILYNSCDGNSEAFMNLWSSAEAGKAASAIAGQGFENFNDWLGQITNSANATEDAYATMSNTLEFKTNRIKETINSKLIKAFEKVSPVLSNLADMALAFVESIDVDAIYESVKSIISSFGEIKTSLTETVREIKESFSTGFKGAYTIVANAFNKIKDKITNSINSAKDTIKKAIDKIKGFFDWSSWKIQLPNLPTLNVSWESTSGGLFGGIKYPTFSWNARAMDNPLILGNATIFGASGGTLEGGGERGEEIVGGKDTIMGMIGESVSKALNESMNSQLESIYSLLSNQLPQMASAQVVLDSGALVGSTVREMDRALGAISARKKRGGL